ncbi:MAG: hypothetical protein WBL53_18235 [Pseudonocardiaceae bacterium]
MKWGAGRVDDGGWDEFDVAGVDEDFPAGVMHVPMVGVAEQYAWIRTAAVSGDQGSADG